VPNGRRWLRHLTIITAPSLVAAVFIAILSFLVEQEIGEFGHPTNRSEAWDLPVIISVCFAWVWFIAVTPVLVTHVLRQKKYEGTPSVIAAAASPPLCIAVMYLGAIIGESLARL